MRLGSIIRTLAVALAVLSCCGLATAYVLAKSPIAFKNKLEGSFDTVKKGGRGMMALQTEVKGQTPSGLLIIAEGTFLAEQNVVEALRKGTMKEASVEKGSLKATIAGNTILGLGSAKLTRMPNDTIRLEGTFKITGGTKKLASASGEATVSGVADLKKKTISLQINGNVTVLGEKR